MLARRILNSIENLISQALIDLEISHEEYKRIINEEENYRRPKQNIGMIKSDNELNEEDSKRIENNKNIRENKVIKSFFKHIEKWILLLCMHYIRISFILTIFELNTFLK